MSRSRLPRVLGMHPTARGMGWIVFEGPLAPYDWGSPPPRPDRHADCLRRVARLIDKYQPETLVLEAGRQGRLSKLCRAVAALAADRGVDVAVCSRDDVRACFRHLGARSRQEIAEAVARHVDALRPRLPKARAPWESDRRSMALFVAASLVLTHYALDARRLLDDLRDAA